MTTNPFETLDMADYEPTSASNDVTKQNGDDSVAADDTNEATPLQAEAVTPSEVEEKRKMWQIFTDKNGEQQRNAVPMPQSSEQGSAVLTTGSRVVIAPRKPPRNTEVVSRANGNVDTVVFEKDSTYVAFTSVDVESEDEELFGGESSSQGTSSFAI